MHLCTDSEAYHRIQRNLAQGNAKTRSLFPGESQRRQPIHTVYGGAQIFKSDTARKMGDAALKTLQEYAPDAAALAQILGYSPVIAEKVYERLILKLQSEPVEDFRIDFEDGYGNRPDSEEDGHAAQAAREVAQGLTAGTLPPFIGIRIKSLTDELFPRAARTLDIFLSTLLDATQGKLPPGFVLTLPKITNPEQVTSFTDLLELYERNAGLIPGTLRFEIMVETTQSIFSAEGTCALPELIRAGRGRILGAHFGTYDYTAANEITASCQSMAHPACDFARQVMKVALSGTGVFVSDGATNIMPVGPHRAVSGALTTTQRQENQDIVHRAWRLSYSHIRQSLELGLYQGWDLHPAQLPVRFAATYAFFLEGYESASRRLNSFMEKTAQATLLGDVFDDAATGQGLLNFFLRAVGCGAIGAKEAKTTGLTLDEIATRSFLAILKKRRST